MKVIFVTREGYNLPGARIRCYNFAKEIAKYGIETEVLSFSDTLGALDGERESQMPLMQKIKYNYSALQKLKSDKEAIFYLQRFNYHSFAPFLAHLFNKNKIILDLDDWEIRENPRYYFKIYPSSKAHYFTREIAKRSIFCVAASRFLERFLLKYNKMTLYLPSGVDTELFNFSDNGRDRGKIVFSWIGTLHKREYIENIKFALECFSILRKKYSQIIFEIRGDGIYKNDLIKIIKNYNDQNIVLKGWIHPNEISVYLESIHIGLFPIARYTKFNLAKSPTKLFEYMAMAKPTISSFIGEPVHIIQDGDNGLLAKTKEEFIEKMQNLIEDSNLCQHMGYKARETIENKYSLNVLGRQLYEILRHNA